MYRSMNLKGFLLILGAMLLIFVILHSTLKGTLNEKAEEEKPQEQKKQNTKPRTWQGQKPAVSSEPQTFEDMMARFKQTSDEKMADLRHAGEQKHGGYSRRGRGGN